MEAAEIIEPRLAEVLPLNAGDSTIMQLLYARDVQMHRPHDAAEFAAGFAQANASWFSQNGEDGILQYLLALMNGRSYRSVEIGAGDGIENNTANLIVHHGYRGLLVDPSWALEYVGAEFYRRVHTTRERPPAIAREFAETENVNAIVESAGFSGPVDVLSIDVDGNDFWIFDALTIVQPKILVLELNLQLGPDVSVAMPYKPGYAYWEEGNIGYMGASVRAYDALARRRGLVFAGCDRTRTNGFWIERGAISAVSNGVDLSTIWGWERSDTSLAHQQHLLTDFPWVSVPL